MLVSPKNFSMHTQTGLSLLEVLISMLVLSIGLFGLAGLQSASLRANNSAYQRTITSMLANDILDRMRANPALAKAGNYNVAIDDNEDGSSYTSGDFVDKCKNNGAGDCTPTDLKNYDLFDWFNSASKLKQLPDATASIKTDVIDSSNGTYRILITINWSDYSAKEGGLGGRDSESFSYASIVKL